MRILVIAPENLPVPPIKGGSVETCIYHIFSRISKEAEVVILSRTSDQLPPQSVYHEKFQILRFPSPSGKVYIRNALQQVVEESFDLIQIENRPKFVSWARAAFPHTPIILSLHSLTFISRLSKQQAEQVLAQVNGVTTVGYFVGQTVAEWYPKHADKIYPIHLGVDSSRFSPPSFSDKWKVRQDWGITGDFNVLYVGRIVPDKGLHSLIKAVSIVQQYQPNIQLTVVGSAWPSSNKATLYIKYVRSLAKKLRVNILFTGYISPYQIQEMYHLGDVFVCPTRYPEAFGMVNTEAMACGIPTIASNRGGIQEIIQHGYNGLLVDEYNNPKAFAQAIYQMIRYPSFAQKLATRARAHVVEAFTWKNTVQTLVTHYHSVLAKEKGKQMGGEEKRAKNREGVGPESL